MKLRRIAFFKIAPSSYISTKPRDIYILIGKVDTVSLSHTWVLHHGFNQMLSENIWKKKIESVQNMYRHVFLSLLHKQYSIATVYIALTLYRHCK